MLFKVLRWRLWTQDKAWFTALEATSPWNASLGILPRWLGLRYFNRCLGLRYFTKMFRPEIFYRNSSLMPQFVTSLHISLSFVSSFMNKIRQTNKKQPTDDPICDLYTYYLIHLYEQKWNNVNECIYEW